LDNEEQHRMAGKAANAADVIVIGGGHNGLAAAGYLARTGYRAMVLERLPVVGGAAVTEEFHPGFRNSVASYTVSLLNPKVIRDLELRAHDLEVVERPVATFYPVDAERYLMMPYSLAGRQMEVAKFSARDAERLPAFEAAIERATKVIQDLVLVTPPNAGGGILELLKSASISRRMIGLGLDDKRLVADLFTKSVADFLAPWFESEIVRGALAFDGIVGSYASPFTPGTAYVLMHHYFGEVNGKTGVWGHAIGGMGAITEAMARSAAAHGAEIRTDAAVARVLVEYGRAQGVVLASGEELRARAVAANVGPKLLFRDLVPEAALPDALRRRFLNIKTGSASFRMNVALAELPDFTCRPGTNRQEHHGAGIIIGPTLDYLDRAYLDARQHGWSKEPVVELVIPSTLDRTLAPEGRHVASLFVQHAAPELPPPRSWSDPRERDAFAEVVIDTVTRHAPNFRRSIIARQVLSPWDLEQRFGLTGGDIFHGQLSLDQLFSLRPVLGHAAYRMPVEGLYLCGSGAHPGGGVTGLPGRNAAHEIITDLKRRRV
jgi:phytoene dehydrogenase-like protein